MKVAIIGFGFMGGVHLHHWQRLHGVEIVAVCDANPEAKNNGRVKGNLGPEDDSLNLESIPFYTDLPEMLAETKPEAVSITLPTHLHARASIQVMEAGAHVLCEKPMALSLEDADAMILAARTHGRHLMIAHCIRFWPAYQWLKEKKDSGCYGRFLSGDFNRRCTMPDWSEGKWFKDAEKSGGISLDLHIHDLDFIHYLCGSPYRQHAWHTVRKQNQQETITEIRTLLEYQDGKQIGSIASWLISPDFGFEMSYHVSFEKATVVYNSRCQPQLKVYPATGGIETPTLEPGDGYEHEIRYFSRLVSGEEVPELMPPEDARQSLKLALQSSRSTLRS